MVMTINGLGRGPFADRRPLDERQRRRRAAPEQAPRPVEDTLAPLPGQTEQMRAEFAALDAAIRETERALAILGAAGDGLARVEAELAALHDDLREGAAPGAAAPPLSGRLAAIDAVAGRTRFGGLRLLDGSLGCSGAARGDGLTFVTAGPRVRSSPPQGYEVLLTQEPVRATVMGRRPLSGALIDGGLRLVLREGGRTVQVTTQQGQSAPEVAAALRRAADAAGLALGVELTRDARLVVQHRLFGAGHRFAVWSAAPGVLSGEDGAARVVANGRDVAGTLNEEPADGAGETLTGRAGNPTTEGLVVRYTGLPYTGSTGRLPRRRPAILEPRVFAGRVTVAQQALTFRLDGEGPETVSLRLDSVRPRALGRGVATASGFLSLAEIRADTPAEREDARRIVARAAGEVAELRAQVRGLAEGRLAAHLARLRVQAENLTAAGPSDGALPPGESLEAVRALSNHIRREARTALSAQTRPPQGTLLALLGGGADGTAGGPPRRGD